MMMLGPSRSGTFRGSLPATGTVTARQGKSRRVKRRASQLLRLAYVDLVRRRSRVRVVRATELETRERPIFIIGPYRSGTTLLRYAVDSHSNIACPPESDFLAALTELTGATRASRGFAAMGFDEEHVANRIRLFADYFFANYARSKGKSRWADKSPTYVQVLPFIRRVFPTAQFVFIHRFPLDQIHSHTKGGIHTNEFIERNRLASSEDVRAAAARYWAVSTRAMVDFAQHDPASLQLRYEDLCASPRAVLGSLLTFLDEPWEEGVLEFHKVPHDVGMEAASVRSTTGFDIRSGEYSAWPLGVVHECADIVRETARAVGYSQLLEAAVGGRPDATGLAAGV
jgi:protein-tyrosine sulfotransferase